jgi:hypothetical protein
MTPMQTSNDSNTCTCHQRLITINRHSTQLLSSRLYHNNSICRKHTQYANERFTMLSIYFCTQLSNVLLRKYFSHVFVRVFRLLNMFICSLEKKVTSRTSESSSVLIAIEHDKSVIVVSTFVHICIVLFVVVERHP